MLHFLYLGHFARDRDFIRFARQGDAEPAWYRPVVVRPLDTKVIAKLLAEDGVASTTIPEDWGVSLEEEGFLVCDRYAGSPEARDFIKRLALHTGCDIVDYSALSFLAPEELWLGHPAAQATTTK